MVKHPASNGTTTGTTPSTPSSYRTPHKGCSSVSRRQPGSSHIDAEEQLTKIAGIVRPWEGFHRSQLQPFLDRVVVSHKPDHGTRGSSGTTAQLHNETAYGLIASLDDGSHRVVVRKKLSDVRKRKDLESVRNPDMRMALLELWDKVESEGGKPADFASRAGSEGVVLDGRKQIVRRVRIVDKQRVIPISDKSGNVLQGLFARW